MAFNNSFSTYIAYNLQQTKQPHTVFLKSFSLLTLNTFVTAFSIYFYFASKSYINVHVHKMLNTLCHWTP